MPEHVRVGDAPCRIPTGQGWPGCELKDGVAMLKEHVDHVVMHDDGLHDNALTVVAPEALVIAAAIPIRAELLHELLDIGFHSQLHLL